MEEWTTEDWTEDLSETKVFTASSAPAAFLSLKIPLSGLFQSVQLGEVEAVIAPLPEQVLHLAWEAQ